MQRHADVPAWLCVGDLGNDVGIYEAVPAPIYWIKGNNESFDRIADGSLPAGLRFLPNGVPCEVSGIRLVGVGGTFAPSWYDTQPAALPHPRKGTIKATVLADKRRHFVRSEVESAKAAGRVDLLLSHEAPRPFRVGRMDAGKTPINELIAALRPRVHFFGHHHRYAEQDIGGTRSIGLDLVSRSYVLLDPVTWSYERRDT
jgi:Icc-related predicted phosphoesterase